MMAILRDWKCDGDTVESTCHDNRHFAFQRQQALQHAWFPVQGDKRGIELGYAVYPYLTFAVISQRLTFRRPGNKSSNRSDSGAPISQLRRAKPPNLQILYDRIRRDREAIRDQKVFFQNTILRNRNAVGARGSPHSAELISREIRQVRSRIRW